MATPTHQPASKKAKGNVPEVLSVPGFPDIVPKDAEVLMAVRRAVDAVAERGDFRPLETPIVEREEIFRGIEEGMLLENAASVKVRGTSDVVLRPDGVIPVLRSYFEHHLAYISSPLKTFRWGPVFRGAGAPRPDRASIEAGFDIMGDSDPVYDGVVLLATLGVLRELSLKDLKLRVSMTGCRVCRPTYREKLKNYYRPRKATLCAPCADLLEKNPAALLTCEKEQCGTLRPDAPIILDYLCQSCNNHFKTVLELIEDNGVLYEPVSYLPVEVPYYNRTVFEIVTPLAAAPIAWGGRYDYLSELVQKRALPGVGATISVPRLVSALRAAQPAGVSTRASGGVFFVAVGEQAKKASLRLMEELRAGGITVFEALGKKSLKAQLRVAEKIAVPATLLFGQKEFFEKTVLFRDMKTGAQETIVLDQMTSVVKRHLK